ncbi:MAG: spermidine synthase [Geobacteraceae bacterium]|nr:spermidine synthase [Geobacteraceae bacterium]NTW79901.1 spermidine synthase [Geobacteraceae bacterium]
MAQPWKTIERIATDEGALELRQRGERDFIITIGPQILMNSLANRSEVVLGQIGCSHLKEIENPRVLVGGLGMGFTLKATLDSLPATATVIVAELNPTVHEWCRGPLAVLTDNAVKDPRVTVEICDVASRIRQTALNGGEQRFDAIILDLYRGPHAKTHHSDDPLYGSRAIENMCAALNPCGTVAVWGENYDESFEKRLRSAGFTVTIDRPGRGGLRHAVFLAQQKQSKKTGKHAS